jgi:hypothetical protein
MTRLARLKDEHAAELERQRVEVEVAHAAMLELEKEAGREEERVTRAVLRVQRHFRLTHGMYAGFVLRQAQHEKQERESSMKLQAVSRGYLARSPARQAIAEEEKRKRREEVMAGGKFVQRAKSETVEQILEATEQVEAGRASSGSGSGLRRRNRWGVFGCLPTQGHSCSGSAEKRTQTKKAQRGKKKAQRSDNL